VLTATCSYLAERVYKRTDTDYDGPRNEVMGEYLPFDQATKYGTDYEPVCKFFDKSGLVATTDATDDTRPYLMHAGYVATAGKKGARGHASESLENWCKRVPVLDVEKPSATRDIVFTISEKSSRWMLFQGRNLGRKTPSGKIGKVEAQDQNGQWQSLDIYDEATKSDKGGWSEDGKILYARLPPSKKGFATSATPQMLPHQLLALSPTPYIVRVTRANDPTANLVELLSDGAESVGEYSIDVRPQVLQVIWPAVAAGTQEIRGEFCHPVWLRQDITELTKSVYRIQNGVYTKLNVAFSWYDDVPWQPDPNVVCDPANERAGVSIANPSPTTFDGTGGFVFAYH
jgi:hypothetical protein